MIHNKPVVGKMNVREYLNDEIYRDSHLMNDVYGTNISTSAISPNSYRGVDVQQIGPFQDIRSFATFLNPETSFTKAYLRLERLNATSESEDHKTITWDVSLGLNSFIEAATATKILVENIKSIRAAAFIGPFTNEALSQDKYALIPEFQYLAAQSVENIKFQFSGRNTYATQPYGRSIVEWYETARNNIQEHNQYLDRRGYSGTYYLPKSIDRLDKLSLQLIDSDLEKKVFPQMICPIQSTTIGSGGQTINIVTGSNFVPILPFGTNPNTTVIYINNIKTDAPSDISALQIINRKEGWQAIASSPVLDVRDFDNQQTISTGNKIDLRNVVLVGTLDLSSAYVVIDTWNTVLELELTIQINNNTAL